jgi:hypothetical protein
MIECDYLIIWMWISWIWLKYKLKWDVVLLDKSPFSYKIWESHIPNLLDADIWLLKLAPKISKNLKSYQLKKWSIFADSKESLYWQFVYTDLKDAYTFHSERPELEKLLVDELNIDYKVEEVIDIDFDNKIVETNINKYKVNKYILDCSWPNMFIANKLWLVKKVYDDRKSFATWWYWDVKSNDNSKKKVDEYTLLNQIDDKTWIWQIPLFWWKIISIWVVSLSYKVEKKEYLDIVEKYKHPYYKDINLSNDKESYLWKIHYRLNFSKISSKSSSDSYILVWDSYCFADPIYSVWTWVSMSESIYLAKLLNDNTFSSELYQKKLDKIMWTLVWEFTSWYDDSWRNIYVLEKIQEDALQWKLIKNELASYEDILKRYSDLIYSIEKECWWNHEKIINSKWHNIIMFFSDWTMRTKDSSLEVWFFWMTEESYEIITNKEVIDFLLSIKNKVYYVKDLLSFWKECLSENNYPVLYKYILKLFKKKLVPIYFDNKN